MTLRTTLFVGLLTAAAVASLPVSPGFLVVALVVPYMATLARTAPRRTPAARALRM